jgi:hypothetical protein
MIMNKSFLRIRISAIGAPALIVFYGLLRLVDVLEANQSHGFNWNLGHVLFFFAFILFGMLSLELRKLIHSKTKSSKVLSYIFTIAVLFGDLCFLWGILGDLFKHLNTLPALLKIIGPLLFQVGMLGLLIMLVAMRPQLLPFWSPVLVFAGFLIFAINLNLLPIGGIIILFGLLPLILQKKPNSQ